VPELLMPRMDAEMKEGRIVEWIKKEGEKVERGQPIAKVEGEKVVFELEANRSGVLKKILAQPGTVVPVGEPVAIIEES